MRPLSAVILFLSACGTPGSALVIGDSARVGDDSPPVDTANTDTVNTINTDTGTLDTTTDTGILDTVINGSPSEDDDMDGFSEDDGDCDDTQPGTNPATTDLVGDFIDQNCDGVDGTDTDGDTFASLLSGGDDCNDTDPATYPDANEIWYDGIDQGCLGESWAGDDDQDGDGVDTYLVGGADCNDTNAEVYPNRGDPDDGIDNNCNGLVDATALMVIWDDAGVEISINDGVDGLHHVELHPLIPESVGDFETVAVQVVDGYGMTAMTAENTAYEDEITTITYTYWSRNGFGAYPPGTTFAWGPRAADVCQLNCVFIDPATL